MAGNYMDAPASRMAYDRDGSVAGYISLGGVITQLTGSKLRALNSETEVGDTMTVSAAMLAVVFPIPMNLKSIFYASTTSALWTVETSQDTTTGVDGTWSSHGSFGALRDVKPQYRQASQLITLNPALGTDKARGVRLRAQTNSLYVHKALHIYGDPATTATKDRLALWHPTLDEPVSPNHFDWGNVPRASSADKSFRIKNLSSALTALSPALYAEALTPGSPSVSGMHTFSSNGGATFLSSLTLPDIAPGATTSVLTVRRTVPTNAQVSVWSARIAADVTTWV